MGERNELSAAARVKSRPSYMPLRAEPCAQCHLLVAERPGLDAVLRLIDELDAMANETGPVEVYWLGKKPDVLARRVTLFAFNELAVLATALERRLSTAGMGLRLYVAGREAFVWQASLAARAVGLREDEIQREACGSRARRVYCVHCRHIFAGVTTTPVPCPCCGMSLAVRDHFSPALAAYLGVCAIAQYPGEPPPPTEPLA